MVKYIPTFNTTLIEDKNTYPIHEYTQLSYVLPKNSLNLLPTKIQHFLTKNYPNLHNDNCKILWYFIRYFWESHIDLPHIDINKLNTLIKLQL